MKLWLPLLLALGLLVSASASHAQQETPDGELRAAHERFFAAFSREDMVAALAEASTAPEEREWVRDTLQAEFDKASDYVFKIERFTVLHLEEPQAFTRARISWSWRSNGKSQTENGLQTWDFVWIRQGGAWKLRAYRFAEANLLKVFKEAADQAQRARLLKQDADIVGGWLPLALREQADEAAKADEVQEAERLSTIAFEVAEWLDDDYERAYCHLSRGTVRKRAKKWNPALDDWDKARLLFEKQNNNQGLAKVWRNSGGLYQQLAEFERSVKAYEKSVWYWRREKNEGAVAEVIQDLGTVHQDAGRSTEAEKCYEQALEIQTRLGRQKEQAQLLGNLAAIRQEQQRYAESLELYERSTRIYTEIKDRSGESVFLTNLGNLYDLLGQNEEAERHHRRAVKTAEDSGHRVNLMIALHNLGSFLARQGRPDEAIEASMTSLKIASEIGDSRYEANSLNTIGELYFREKEWTRAISVFQDALEVSRDTGNRVQEGVAVLGLAGSHARLRRTGLTLHYFEEARRLAVRTGSQSLQMDVARMHADFYRENGDLPRAVQLYRIAISLVEQIRVQTGVRSLQTSYLRQYSFLYHRLAECLARLGNVRGAFAVSEQLRARSLVDIIRSGMNRVTKTMTEDERSREATLELQLGTLTRALEKTVRTDEAERVKEQQTQARAELQQFQDRLYARHPQLRTQRADFEPATPEELSRRILTRAPKVALLSYFPLPERTLLFVVRRDKAGKTRLRMHSLPVSSDTLIRRTNEFWQACSTPESAYQSQAQALYRDLFQTALPDLAGIEHLVVVAGSDLGGLPFSALLDRNRKPLVASYALSYAPSATALMFQADLAPEGAAPGGQLPLLAFGNPFFPPNLAELPATEGEVREISRLFGSRARTFIRKEALESRAKELLGRARIVHFATHGTLDERAPMYSSLVLTRDDHEDGFLQARELSELDLHAELVVLSACETALGQKVRGEGVVGLAWALFVGGAQSSLASQWQVPDESTRTLMVQFYRCLVRPDTNRAEAIRQAQLKLMRDKRYAHPYHWAPFALLGQWLPRVAASAATRITHN